MSCTSTVHLRQDRRSAPAGPACAAKSVTDKLLIRPDITLCRRTLTVSTSRQPLTDPGRVQDAIERAGGSGRGLVGSAVSPLKEGGAVLRRPVAGSGQWDSAVAIAYLANPQAWPTTGPALTVDGGMAGLRLPSY